MISTHSQLSTFMVRIVTVQIFIKKIRDIVNDFNTDFFVISGDFNLVLDPEKDYYNYRHVNNPNARREVIKRMEEFNLIDVWRVQHNDLK